MPHGFYRSGPAATGRDRPRQAGSYRGTVPIII
jgi:hypothetical protein